MIYLTKGEESTKDGQLELVNHPDKGLKLEIGGYVEGHPWHRIKLVPKSEALTFVLRDDKRVQCLDMDLQFWVG